MNMRIFVIISTLVLAIVSCKTLGYERNKAVPVEKVVYGKVETVRHITDTELIRDKSAGWKHFGGALLAALLVTNLVMEAVKLPQPYWALSLARRLLKIIFRITDSVL